MTEKFYTAIATSKKPHVKWGALVISVFSIIAESALMALNFYANTGKMANANLGLGFLAAYGWLFGMILLLAGLGYFFESFLPSYRKAKKLQAIENYKAALARATRDSLVSNSKKEAEAYVELLEVWHK